MPEPLDDETARLVPAFLSALKEKGPWAGVGAFSWAEAKGLTPRQARRLLFSCVENGNVAKVTKGEDVLYKYVSSALPCFDPAKEKSEAEEASEDEQEEDEQEEDHPAPQVLPRGLTLAANFPAPQPSHPSTMPSNMADHLMAFARLSSVKQKALMACTRRVAQAEEELAAARSALSAEMTQDEVAARPSAPPERTASVPSPAVEAGSLADRVLGVFGDGGVWRTVAVAEALSADYSIVSATVQRLFKGGRLSKEGRGQFRLVTSPAVP